MGNRWRNSGNSGWLYFWGLQNHCRRWCSHEIKRRVLLGKKVMTKLVLFSSVAHLCQTLWPHESQHARPPCPSPTPGVYPNLGPLTRWCHPAISSSVIPFSSWSQSLPASGSFSMSQLFPEVANVLEFQLQHESFQWTPRLIFRMDWLDLLAVQGTLKSLLQHHSSKALSFFWINLWHSAFFTVQLSHPYMTTTKTRVLTRHTFVGKVMSRLFNMLSSLVITFLPRSKHLLISWLQLPSAVILGPRKIKPDTVSTVSLLFPMKWWDQMPWSLFSECWALSQLLHSPLSLSSRGFLVPLHFLP